MNEGLNLKATARVTIKKYDENDNFIGTEEHEVELTTEEASNLWHSLQQE